MLVLVLVFVQSPDSKFGKSVCLCSQPCQLGMYPALALQEISLPSRNASASVLLAQVSLSVLEPHCWKWLSSYTCLRKERARNSLVRLLLNVVDTLPSVGFLLEPSAMRGTHVCVFSRSFTLLFCSLGDKKQNWKKLTKGKLFFFFPLEIG